MGVPEASGSRIGMGIGTGIVIAIAIANEIEVAIEIDLTIEPRFGPSRFRIHLRPPRAPSTWSGQLLQVDVALTSQSRLNEVGRFGRAEVGRIW